MTVTSSMLLGTLPGIAGGLVGTLVSVDESGAAVGGGVAARFVWCAHQAALEKLHGALVTVIQRIFLAGHHAGVAFLRAGELALACAG